MPHARTWTVGLQRALTKDMAVEVRYVGTRGVDQWSELNYNERNLIENGFFNEFKLAMANLQANNAAGGARLGSFAYFGAGTGTTPLPTYLAYINGQHGRGECRRPTRGDDVDEHGADAGPGPHQPAAWQFRRRSRRRSDAPRQRGWRPASPANFFVVNPDVEQRQRDRQRRLQRLPRAAARTAPAAVARASRSTRNYQYAHRGRARRSSASTTAAR